jgi:hypothetical protein
VGYRKAGSLEEVLGLEAEEVAKLVVMHQALGVATWMAHVVDEFTGEGLASEIAVEDATPPGDSPAVWMGERGLIDRLGWVYGLSQVVD